MVACAESFFNAFDRPIGAALRNLRTDIVCIDQTTYTMWNRKDIEIEILKGRQRVRENFSRRDARSLVGTYI